MKVSSFEIIEQRPSGELQAELSLEYDNSTGKRIHAIRYAVNFLDHEGFPLETQTCWTECELDPGESACETVSATIVRVVPSIDAAGINARATATLFTRERIVLGEFKFPETPTEPARISKEIASSSIDSPLQVIASRADEGDGDVRAECRLLVTNKLNTRLEVALQIHLLDADGDELDSNSDSTPIPALSTVSVESCSQVVSNSQLRGATLKAIATVYSPAATVDCESKALSIGATAEQNEDDCDSDADDPELEESGVEVAEEHESEEHESEEHESEEYESEEYESEEYESEEYESEEYESEDSDAVDAEEDSEAESSDEDGLDQKVRRVLTAANATEYASAFAENEITADVLSSLSDADLAAMGIAALGARKRILAAISADVEHRSQRGLRSAPPVSISADTRELPRSAVASTDWHQVTAAFSQQFLPHGSVVLAPDASYKKLTGARGYATQLGSSGRVLMLYDDTLFRSAKDGITVSDLGVHWKNQFDSPGFTPWSLLPFATAAGKSVSIQPGASANVAFGGAQCATVIACFINAACGAFMASMPLQVHPQFEELQSALAWMLQRGENRTVTLKDPDAIVRLLFKVREGRPVLAIFRPALESAEGFRVSALIQQLGKFRAYTSDGGRDWFDREYATIELGFAAQHAFLILRALHLKPDGATVHIERSGA